MARSKSNSFKNDVEAASPPAPSRKDEFGKAHDELVMLQNVSRVFIRAVTNWILATSGKHNEVDGKIIWTKYVSDGKSFRQISTNAERKEFLESKMMSKSDKFDSEGTGVSSRRKKDRVDL